MRTVIDLTGDASINEPFALPSPGFVGDASLSEDPMLGVRITLGELDVVMTFPQFLAYTDALNAWRFRGCGCHRGACGKGGCGELDMNGDHALDHEHEVLRTLVRSIESGELTGRTGFDVAAIHVPEPVRDAVRHQLRAWRGTTKQWRTVADRLRQAEARIVELEGELAAAKKRKKA